MKHVIWIGLALFSILLVFSIGNPVGKYFCPIYTAMGWLSDVLGFWACFVLGTQFSKIHEREKVLKEKHK